MKFEDRNANFWKWGLEAAIGCFILVVGWSTYHLSPSLFWIILAICVAEFLATLVYTVFTTVPIERIRHEAWRCIGIVAVSLAFNAIIHATLSRRHDVAEQNKKAKQIETERNLRVKQIETDLEIKKNASVKSLDEQKERTLQAQNHQLALLKRNERRSFVATAPSPIIPITSLGEETYRLSEIEKNNEKPVMLSPEEVQESAFNWIIAGIIASVSAVIGTAISFIRSLIKTTSEDRQIVGLDSHSLPNSSTEIRSHRGSPRLTNKVHQNSPVRLSSEAPEALQKQQSKAPQNEPYWMDFYRVGEWEMPNIAGCRWKENIGQRSLELYTDPEQGKPVYLGRFGVSAQEIWKSTTETERVNLILTRAQIWKDAKGVN